MSRARLLVVTLGAALAGCGRDAPRPDVLLLTVETTRADRVRHGGGEPDTMAELEALCADGARFPTAISASCFTAPSMASLATGVSPESHGVLEWGRRGGAYGRRTLAEALARLGYRTIFVAGHGALRTIDLLKRGFAVFEDRDTIDAKAVTDLAIGKLEGGGGPVFLWVHYFDPHGPYRPPEELARRFLSVDLEKELGELPYAEWEARLGQLTAARQEALLEALYLGEIAHADREMARMMRAFRERRGGEPLLLVTADHGENLADHEPRYAHRNALYDSLVRVPLLIRPPGGLRGGVTPPVQARGVDLFPTILDYLGTYREADHPEGRSLRPAMEGRGAGFPAFAFCDSGRQEDPRLAVRGAGRKLACDLRGGRMELYDLENDPEERRNLAEEREEEAEALRARLFRWFQFLRRPGAVVDSPLSESERAVLRSLGYGAGK